jgi:hypothetical protein
MIDFLFHHLWFECQLIVAGIIGFTYFSSDPEDRSKDFHTKKDALFVSMLILSGPLGVTAMLMAATHAYIQGLQRAKCSKILARWGRMARKQQNTYEISSWEWHMEKKYAEMKYTSMRETIGSLTDDELEELITASDDVIGLEREIVEAVADEIIHREIAKG